MKQTALLLLIFIMSGSSFGQLDLDWSFNVGGATVSSTEVWDSDTDGSGSLIAVGAFSPGDPVNFNPLSTSMTYTATDVTDGFLAKYSLSGELSNFFHLTGTSTQRIRTVDIDSDDNIIVTGRFNNTVDIDPSGAVSNLIAPGVPSSPHMFIVKYDNDFNLLWGISLACDNNAFILDVDITTENEILIAGMNNGSVELDPASSGGDHTSTGSYDLFVAKYDVDGNYTWSFQIGGAGSDFAKGIHSTSTDSLWLVGGYNAPMDFDPSGSSSTLDPSDGKDVFIAKYDGDGNFGFVGKIGGIGGGSSISTSHLASAITSDDKLLVAGNFSGTVDINMHDPDEFNITAVSSGNSAYLVKYDMDGNEEWADVTGADSWNTGWRIRVNNQNQIFLTCASNSASGFSPNPEDLAEIIPKVDSDGAFDFYLAKYEADGEYLFGHSLCDDPFYEMPPMISTYEDSIVYITGIFESANLDLDDGTSPVESLIGDFFVIKTGDPTICGVSTNTIVETACFEYVSPSGQMVTSSGVFNDTIPNSCGADSIITIDLTINTVEVGVTQSGITLTADASGASYQWVDCDDGYSLISGETDQSFTPPANGNYAVIIDDGTCSDTSDCFAITNLQICDPNEELMVYPNPTDGELIIYSGDRSIEELFVYSSSGKEVLHLPEIWEAKVLLDVSDLPVGYYVVRIKVAGEVQSIPLQIRH